MRLMASFSARGTATGVGDFVTAISVPEAHPHDQSHEQPLTALDPITFTCLAGGAALVCGARRARHYRDGSIGS
jgi:hypothetical protein